MQLATNDGKKIEVNDEIFGCEYNEGLVHDVVTAYMAAGRQGTKAQKTRAQVRGGGKKPWKQKGSGQARAGTTRGPLWRGGGVTFAAVPRDFSKKVNKKAYRKGMQIILSELVRQDRFVVTNKIDLPAPKTKELVSYLKGLQLNDVLIVGANASHDLYLAARNIPNVMVCDHTEINPVDLMSYKKVLFTADAVKEIEKRYS